VYRIIAIAIVLFILASAGYAQVPSGNVFVGYSYMSADLDRDRGSLLVRDGRLAHSNLGAPRIKRRFQFELEQLRGSRIVLKSRVLRTGLDSNMCGH
jgi:hypothetical protein